MNTKRSLYWPNTLFLILSPPAALIGVIAYAGHRGIALTDVALFVLMYLATGFAITAGYHRHFAHKSYESGALLQFFYLAFGAAALQNSVLRWARDHRIHHQKVDQEEDPYSVMKGLFWAHIGWIFFKSRRANNFAVVPDLQKIPLVRWQERYYLAIAGITGFALPAFLGWVLAGRPLAGFLWGGLLRVVIVHHATFCINSLAHYVGRRPYSLSNSARDSWWLALITYGEGYHNFHHRFAADYRNGYRWYQFDPTKWWIWGMSLLGLASRLRRYRESLILRARLETDHARAFLKADLARSPVILRLENRAHRLREQLEAACHQWEEAKAGYGRMKRSAVARSRQARHLWKITMQQRRYEFEAAQARWAMMIAAAARLTDLSA
ncbi:MAG: fatty acid desaturase [Elusimicrobia bacterium]|nr:fatty acid desaturase [Elusimicrobiota bacterium]